MQSPPHPSRSTLQPLRGDDIVPLYRPDLSGNETAYVLDCLESSWISSIGPYLERFERAISEWTGAAHAIAVCNGTVALHLALHALGIGPGDEVIVPSFTFIASVNAIAQTGAKPVFADARPDDWQLDVDQARLLVSSRCKAILPVHLYDSACDMRAVKELADEAGLAVVEDCAEALGTTLDGKAVGRFGRAGTFSFFGNKTVTTGEGGMLITDDPQLALLARKLRGQGQSFTRRYWHEIRGFNYRMTNVAAAIGVAQMERVEATLARKRQVAASYRELLQHLPVVFQDRRPGVSSGSWLTTVLLPGEVDRDRVIARMAAEGVETRPTFHPAHLMPMYGSPVVSLPVTQNIAARGLSLPSFPGLTASNLAQVAEALASALRAS